MSVGESGDGPAPAWEDAWLLHCAEHAFAVFWRPKVVGLAVSGGSDSMAMLHLMARAAPRAGWAVQAVTVDHALRPGSADEARFVTGVCAGLGVPHDVLVWDHGEIARNLQDQARRARYGLIADWAKAQGIGHVAVAHTADDQAETFLMGLSRAAGLDGLSGMRRDWTEGGVVFRRPFLMQSRAELRAWLTRHGQDWRDDPSNENDRFARVKARRALKALKPLGITVDRLSETIHHLSMALGVVNNATAKAFRRIGQETAGAVMLDRAQFERLDPELSRRILVAALRWMSGGGYAPRADAVERLEEAISQARDATLAGCRIRVTDAAIRILREPRAAARAACPSTGLWDNRWHLSGPHAPGLEIRALGVEGLRLCPDWRAAGLPRDVLIVSPAVWDGAQLVAAPLARKSCGWTATIDRSLAEFILSH